MSAPSNAPRLPLRVLPGTFAVARLAPHDAIPAWAMAKPRVAAPLADRPPGPASAPAAPPLLLAIVRTAAELSIVAPEGLIPASALAERGWRALEVEGPIPFATTGVVSGMTAPLAAAGVGVFVLSTYDTDYVLVKVAQLAQAVAALRAAGFTVQA